jgi:hypothetical protein
MRRRALGAVAVVAGVIALGACTPTKDPAAEAALLQQQLAEARAVALAHPTAADAVAAGYAPVSAYITKIAAHYMRGDRFDRTFVPGEPEVLLYDGNGPDARIVGVAYTSDVPLPGFAGNHDHWHSHPHLCTDPETGLVIDTHADPAHCQAMGGTFVGGINLWMLHAWVVPGFESADGVFSQHHPLLP